MFALVANVNSIILPNEPASYVNHFYIHLKNNCNHAIYCVFLYSLQGSPDSLWSSQILRGPGKHDLTGLPDVTEYSTKNKIAFKNGPRPRPKEWRAELEVEPRSPAWLGVIFNIPFTRSSASFRKELNQGTSEAFSEHSLLATIHQGWLRALCTDPCGCLTKIRVYRSSLPFINRTFQKHTEQCEQNAWEM